MTTLGCRSNHADTAAMMDRLSPDHVELVPFDGRADVYVVNTCTVTAAADRQSRQLLYRAHRRNPTALIIATGCYPTVSPEAIANAAPFVTLVPGADPLAVADIIHEKTGIPDVSGPNPETHPFGLPQSRPYLKVQQGCPIGCSYCILPKARPGSESLSLSEAVKAAASLAASGAREIVVTGTHLGLYGKDLRPKADLATLLKTLAQALPDLRFRISSLEPWDVTEDLLITIADTPQICRHLHLPLQSGSGATLQRMRRPYTPQRFADIVAMAGDLLPGLTLGTDIIVGFPGETEEEFKESREFFSALPLTYAHVFPYSERPGTDAADMLPKISPPVTRRRAGMLRTIAMEKKRRQLASALGGVYDVIFDAPPTDGQEYINGMSREYFPFLVKYTNSFPDTPVHAVRAVAIEEDGMRIIGECITPHGGH